MKKQIIYLLLGFMLITVVSAESVYNIPLKIYDDKVNVTLCKSNLEKFPEVYFKGLRQISISSSWLHGEVKAYYSGSKIIYLNKKCETYLIVEELTHHNQSYSEFNKINNHSGNYREIYEQIWDSIKN
jgi:hypothetical protein